MLYSRPKLLRLFSCSCLGRSVVGYLRSKVDSVTTAKLSFSLLGFFGHALLPDVLDVSNVKVHVLFQVSIGNTPSLSQAGLEDTEGLVVFEHDRLDVSFCVGEPLEVAFKDVFVLRLLGKGRVGIPNLLDLRHAGIFEANRHGEEIVGLVTQAVAVRGIAVSTHHGSSC